jgi:formylglycine-generating enzyme required for sulfatase activity
MESLRFDCIQTRQEKLGDGVVLEMVSIPEGTLIMGSPETEVGRTSEEEPQHQVTLSSFLMGKYPITQAQWQAVAALPKIKDDLDPNPSNFKGAELPVENISWYHAEEFCARLSQKTGHPYRLPSEAEWEYACRAGTTTPFHFGETLDPKLANYKDTYKGTTPVGSFAVANAFGLYDLHGNVSEWCTDHWHKHYQDAPTDGNAWLSDDENEFRILRGGSWDNVQSTCRSAARNIETPHCKSTTIGFRVVCALAQSTD